MSDKQQKSNCRDESLAKTNNSKSGANEVTPAPGDADKGGPTSQGNLLTKWSDQSEFETSLIQKDLTEKKIFGINQFDPQHAYFAYTPCQS